MGKGSGSGGGSGWGSGWYKGKMERSWFPAMPLPAAIICCILNFLIPGLGTAIAGLSVFCCARTEDMDKTAKVVSCFASCGIGFLQLLTTVLLVIGWFWSCFWGVTFIMMSIEYYHNNKVDDYDRGTATEVHVPATHVVYENGSSTPSAVIIQPSFLPYRVVPPGNQTGNGATTQQPVSFNEGFGKQNQSIYNTAGSGAPPPYPGTSSIVNSSACQTPPLYAPPSYEEAAMNKTGSTS